MQDHTAKSVSFGYSQNNANQQLTNGNYIFWKHSGDLRGW